DPQPQRRTHEGSWLARSGARQGWAVAAFSPDTTGTQAPGKGGSGLERGATAGHEESWGRVRAAVEPSHEASQQRGRRKLIFFSHIVAYTTRSSHEARRSPDRAADSPQDRPFRSAQEGVAGCRMAEATG